MKMKTHNLQFETRGTTIQGLLGTIIMDLLSKQQNAHDADAVAVGISGLFTVQQKQ
jgi:hypothetical protein